MTVKVAAGIAVLAVAGGVAGVAMAQSGGGDDRDRATVVRVIDGDTIDAEIDGETQRVRLLNVDTPETKHPDKPVQCLGPEATDFLEGLLAPGEQIELAYDVERTDRYGRTLAGVYRDESLVNAEIAAAGLGVAVLYEPNDRFYQEVLEAQQQAEDAGAGLHDPAVGCTLPALAEALPPLAALPQEIPADLAGIADALAAAAPVIAAGVSLDAAVGLVESGQHVVLSKAYGGQAPAWRQRLDAALPAARAYQEDLAAHQEDLKKAAAKKAAEKKAAERKAAEKRAAEKKAAEQAAAEKKAAEEKAAAERRAADERAADEARRAEAARQTELDREREEARQAERQAQRSHGGSGGGQQSGGTGQQAPRRQQAPSGGYGTDADYPGYTGPRCYAPGGQSWKPC